MSNFFKFFPVVDYKFGDNGSTNKIQNITVYANVIDQVINNVSAYTEYYVLPEDRPDTVSEKLYGTPNYHGSTTSATATIGKRNLDLGQLFLESVSGTFVAGENITSLNNDGVTETIVATSFEYQYNAAHHYENAAGEIVDIDPEVGPGALLTEVTWYQRLERLNDEKRQMKVIKPSIIREVVKSFRDTVGS